MMIGGGLDGRLADGLDGRLLQVGLTGSKSTNKPLKLEDVAYGVPVILVL